MDGKNENDKVFDNFRTNGLHLWFTKEVGVSLIWGAGSYTENQFRMLEKDWFTKAMGSDTVEFYPIGTGWNDALNKKVSKALGADPKDGFPVGHVDLKHLMKAFNILNKLESEKFIIDGQETK